VSRPSSRPLLAALAMSCFVLVALVARAGVATADVQYPPTGKPCFSISNGGQGDFNNDGFEVRKIGIDSFDVVVRWQKSVLCPLPGTLDIEIKNMDTRSPCSVISKTVYSNGGHFENWTVGVGHDGASEKGVLSCRTDDWEHLVPGQTIQVRILLAYLGYHRTDWQTIELADDPATDLGSFDLRADRTTIVAGGNKPQASIYGVSKVYWAVRDAGDPSSKFSDGMNFAYTCDPGPPAKFEPREAKRCRNNPEKAIDRAPSDSPKVCAGKQTPCTVALRADHVYEVRQVVENTFSAPTLGPVKQVRTRP
jgi:hypothetical protein